MASRSPLDATTTIARRIALESRSAVYAWRAGMLALEPPGRALACALRAKGVREESCVGILARNHRGFLDITFAGAKAGARLLYLNTDFAGPQLRAVCEREGVTLLVHDEEYDGVMEGIEPEHG